MISNVCLLLLSTFLFWYLVKRGTMAKFCWELHLSVCQLFCYDHKNPYMTGYATPCKPDSVTSTAGLVFIIWLKSPGNTSIAKLDSGVVFTAMMAEKDEQAVPIARYKKLFTLIATRRFPENILLWSFLVLLQICLTATPETDPLTKRCQSSLVVWICW